MTQQLVLSLFPGIDLLGLAFKREGFCVVQGGDVIFGGDIREEHYPAGRFDGVIGGPPCQMFSKLAHMVRHNGHEPKFGNLIPEFERVVSEAKPMWFVMENVPDAPLPSVGGYATWSCILNNRQCFDENGEPAKQNRTRRWTFGDSRTGKRTALMIDVTVFENQEFEYAACGGTHGEGGISREQRGAGNPEAVARALARKRGMPVEIGGSGRPKPELRRNQRLNSCVGFNVKSESSYRKLCELQGIGELELPGWRVDAKCKAVGNGVPLPMGRAIAKAVKEATESESPNEKGSK